MWKLLIGQEIGKLMAGKGGSRKMVGGSVNGWEWGGGELVGWEGEWESLSVGGLG